MALARLPHHRPAEPDAPRTAIEDAGVRLTGLNLYAGRLPGPDRGALSIPGEESERFRANIDVAADFAGSLGCGALNALYGNRVDGVDLEAALDVLNGGLTGSTVLTRKRDDFPDRDFGPGFRIDLHHKDMGIVTDAARGRRGRPARRLPARPGGDGGLDHSAPLRAVERLSGTRV